MKKEHRMHRKNSENCSGSAKKNITLCGTICSITSILVFAHLLASCLNPMDEVIVSKAKDRLGPGIIISSPSDSSDYRSTVTVSGTVSDPLSSVGDKKGTVNSLSYEIVPSTVKGTVTIDEQGGFSFEFSTIGMSGDIVVVLTATDWNGNTTKTSLKLKGNSSGPYIVITSPSDLSTYGAEVTIQGTIRNSELDTATTEVASFTYEIENTSIGGNVSFAANGNFSVSFSTSGLSGLLLVQFSATDMHGDRNTVILRLQNDGIGPALGITSPANWTSYSQTVLVSGWVSNSASSGATATEIRTPLSWQVLGSAIQGTTTFDALGNFSFQFGTSSLSGTITVRVTATDIHGNTATADLSLIDSGSDIPSFTAVPGTGKVTFSWDPVPLSSGYTLKELISGQQYAGISSPYVLSGLKNGDQYVFQLKSSSSSGEDDYSQEVSCIPLSELSLVPVQVQDYARIKLEWAPIPGTDTYRLYRALSRDGSYAPLSGAISAHSYSDGQIQRNAFYYYKVEPNGISSIRSQAVGGITSFFPKRGQRKALPVTIAGTSFSQDVAVSGNYAYIAESSNSKISIMDISNPMSPQYVKSIDMPGETRGIYADANYVYVCGYKFLKVLSISNPTNPTEVYSYSESGNHSYQDVVVSGGYAYVAANTADLKIFDLRNMSSVPAPYSANVDGQALGIAVNGTYAYVASTDGTKQLQVFDVSTPSSPSASWSIDLGTDVGMDVTVSGGYAYVALNNGGMAIVDTSTHTLAGTYSMEGAISMAVRGKFAFIAQYDTSAPQEYALRVVDILNAASPSLLRTYTLDSGAIGVCVDGQYAYVAMGGKGLQVINIAEPAELTVEATLSTGGATGLDIWDDKLCVATGSTNTKVYSVSNFKSFTLDKTCSTPNSSYKVVMSGNYAFIANNMSGLQIIDVSDPTKTAIQGSFLTNDNSNAFDIAVLGGYAYLMNYNKGYLRVVDISDPANPVARGGCSLSPTQNPAGVKVKGDYAYVVDDKLRIIDVSQPEAPYEVSASSLSYAGVDVCIQDNRAYVYAADSSGNGVLKIIGVSDPASPYVSWAENATAGGKEGWGAIYVSGDYAFIVNGVGGKLIVYDCYNPAATQKLTEISLGGTASDIVVLGKYAYIAIQGTGVKVIDLWPWSD